MKIARGVLVVLIISIFFLGCGLFGGKKAGIEGTLTDGQGQPLSGIKVLAKQVVPVKGYEQFETTTGANGVFTFNALMPVSEYIISPMPDKWKTKITLRITTGSENQMKVINEKISIRFNLLNNGSVVDTKTGLQWLIYGVTDINADNVLSTAQNIKEGGYNDWRIPTKAEIASLQEKKIGAAESEVTQACCVWVTEPNSTVVDWDFFIDDGNDLWTSSKIPFNDRIVIVRNAGGAPVAAMPSPAPAPSPAPVPTPSPAAPSVATPAPPTPPSPAPAVVEKKEAPAPAPTPAPVPTPAAPKPEPAVAKAPAAPAPAKEAAAPKKVAKVAKEEAAPIGNNLVVHFEAAKSSVIAADVNKLKAFAAKIKSTPGRVTIEGHSDAGGPASTNLRLSNDRAFTVLTMLQKMGVGEKVKIEVRSYGHSKPIADNATLEGRKQNRRVELTLSPE